MESVRLRLPIAELLCVGLFHATDLIHGVPTATGVEAAVHSRVIQRREGDSDVLLS